MCTYQNQKKKYSSKIGQKLDQNRRCFPDPAFSNRMTFDFDQLQNSEDNVFCRKSCNTYCFSDCVQ